MEGKYKNKLTLEQRQTIFQKFNEGITVYKLSEEFKVSRPTIYNILEKMGNTNHKKNDFYFEKNNENKDIMEPQTKTTFLGVTIDTKNGSSNPKINKALLKGTHLLDIMTFIEVVEFKINMTMFDYFWQVVVGNQCVHLVTLVFEWFGYEGEIREQKRNFIKMLKNNNIPYRELAYKDQEIDQYPTIQEELQLLPHDAAKTRSKFLIMEPKDLKMAIMQLKTKNGHKIREYYINLEELLKLYVEYTLYFNHREAQRKITDLEKSMVDLKVTNKNIEESNKRLETYVRSLGITLEEVRDQNDTLIDKTKGLKKQNRDIQRKLGIAVEDRAPLPVSEEKQERFILLKLNDPDYPPYYTIRAQNSYVNRRIKVRRLNFPEMEILLDLKANPNSKTLYNRIKDELKAKGVTFDGNNIDLVGSEVTQEELIEEMKVINDQKYHIL